MMVLKKLAGAAALAGMVALPLAAFAADPIKMGAVNSYSGPMAPYGIEVARGHELAVDQQNAAGGVLGRKIVMIRGDATTPQQGIATVEQLVNKDKVDLIVGTYISAVSNTASDAALRYNKLYWETNASAQELTDRGLSNFLRTGPYSFSFAAGSVDTVRELIAPAMKKEMKDLKVWLEHEDSIYGTQIAQAQKRMLEALGAKVIGVGAHSFKSIDLNDSILRAKQANPDVWIGTGYVPDTNLLLRTANEQGFKPVAMLLVATGNTRETLDSLGAAALEGLLVVSHPFPDVAASYGPGAQEYLAAYRAKYKTDPIAPQGMTAFVGLQILFEAIKAAGSTDMEKVRAAAAAMDKPLGTYATGYGVKFDKNFQNQRLATTTTQWQSGKMVTVFPNEAVGPGAKLKSLARN